MVVRMRETRLVVFDVKNPTALHAGKEYDLPKSYAAYLVMSKFAEFRPGRLRKFAPKEMVAPVHKKRSALPLLPVWKPDPKRQLIRLDK